MDVFVLTEISVQSDMLDRFTLPGYQSSFSLRDQRLGGGIAVYVKDTWCTNPFSVSFSSAECLGLEIVSDVSRISILAVYRPPSQNVLVFLDELKSTLTNLNLVDNFILVGDFNIDTLKPSRSSVCDYLTLLSTYGLECLVQAPTREEFLGGSLVSSCIDHINVRASDAEIRAAVISQKLADHYFVACQLSFQIPVSRGNGWPLQIELVDRRCFDSLVQSYDWHVFRTATEPGALY